MIIVKQKDIFSNVENNLNFHKNDICIEKTGKIDISVNN